MGAVALNTTTLTTSRMEIVTVRNEMSKYGWKVACRYPYPVRQVARDNVTNAWMEPQV